MVHERIWSFVIFSIVIVNVASSVTFFCWNCASDQDCCDNWAGLPYCCQNTDSNIAGSVAQQYYCQTDDDCPTLFDRSRGQMDLDKCCQMSHKCCASWEHYEDSLDTLAASFGGIIPFILGVCCVALLLFVAFCCICCRVMCCRPRDQL
ncbi:uncharacterized protein LOC142340806 [Convolutriloba macropyga]|uniref:uncharacterized protein LOC142340806 n=1 Tax=Convolutriloba macropyga TaxID=536237 RepID=UPI003F5286C1